MRQRTPLSSTDDADAFNELCAYTLGHGSPAFVHQHVVDAFAAQYASEQTKPVQLTFGLVGLYLHLERQFTGREVQLAHMKLASLSRTWPRFELPANRGDITPALVMRSPPGAERDAAIDAWCNAVWTAYHGSHVTVLELLKQYRIV